MPNNQIESPVNVTFDLREGYTLEEETIYRQYNADKLGCDNLLTLLNDKNALLDPLSPMHKAVSNVLDVGEKLTYYMSESDQKKWKMSVVLVLNVLDTPKTWEVRKKMPSSFEFNGTTFDIKTEQNPEYVTAVLLLKNHAEHRAIGKADDWKKFQGFLMAVVGVAMIGLGIGLGLGGVGIGIAVAGGLLTACGSTIFHLNRQKSLSKELSTLAQEAGASPTL